MLDRRTVLGLALAPLMGTAALAQETVTIGYTGPLSGGAALYGRNCLVGLEMAAKEVNDAGGFQVGGKTYKVNVVGLDDRYAPSEAAVNARRLRAQNGAPMVFVPHSGGVAAVQAFNEQEGFILGAYTSVPAVTERGNKLTVRIPPSFAVYIDPFTKTEMGAYGKKLGMAPADHDYAKAWSGLMKPAWTRAGGTIAADNPMSYNKDTDFYSGVSRVLAASPDVLFVGGASEPTALVVKQARELGFQGGFLVMDQAKLDEMAKVLGGYESLEGAIGTMPIVLDPRLGIADYVKRFRDAYKREPTSEASYNYTTLHAAVEAMKLAGSVTDATAIFAKLSEGFAKLTPQHNPGGITGMDARGGSNVQALGALVKGGKVVPVDLAASQ